MDRPIGVLLAAGRGKRLGGRKQFYPCPTADGEKPLVCAAFDAIAPVCRSMVVVLGHLADEVAEVLGDREFLAVHVDPDAAMFESIRAGLKAALERGPTAAILLHPGDHPDVSVSTLDVILSTGARHSARAIIPEYAGRGGHPALVPAAIAHQLVVTNCPQGLAEYWREHPELCVRVAVADEGVVRDLDTLK